MILCLFHTTRRIVMLKYDDFFENVTFWLLNVRGSACWMTKEDDEGERRETGMLNIKNSEKGTRRFHKNPLKIQGSWYIFLQVNLWFRFKRKCFPKFYCFIVKIKLFQKNIFLVDIKNCKLLFFVEQRRSSSDSLRKQNLLYFLIKIMNFTLAVCVSVDW